MCYKASVIPLLHDRDKTLNVDSNLSTVVVLVTSIQVIRKSSMSCIQIFRYLDAYLILAFSASKDAQSPLKADPHAAWSQLTRGLFTSLIN